MNKAIFILALYLYANDNGDSIDDWDITYRLDRYKISPQEYDYLKPYFKHATKLQSVII